MIFRKSFFFFPFFLAFSAFGQLSTTSDTLRLDTLFFLNGEVRAVKIVDTVAYLIRFLPEKRRNKPHVFEAEKSKIFSVKFSNGQERIVYFHDSAAGNVFSIIEAKMYMLGEQEADKNYRNKWPFLIGFVGCSVSPLLFSDAVLVSPLSVPIIPLHTLLPNIHINTAAIRNKNYLQYDTYLMGYVKVAKKKNFMHALLGAGIGLAVGFGTWAIPDKTWNAIGVHTAPVFEDSHLKAFARENFIYGIWAGEVGCAIGIGSLIYKKHKKVVK